MKTTNRLSFVLVLVVILASCGTVRHYPPSKRSPRYERPVVIVRHVPPGHARKIYKQKHRPAPRYQHREIRRPNRNHHYKNYPPARYENRGRRY